jgi:type 1 glutamine amidotransferase
VTVTILAAHGRNEDPWHDTAGTSYRVARLLLELGLDVEVHALAKEVLTSLDHTELLVVNCGGNHVDPEFDGDDASWAEARQGLAAYLERGGPVLALHGATTAFADNPAWRPFLGAEWDWSTSHHPPASLATIEVRAEAHPIAAGLSDFQLFDERYMDLKFYRAVTPYLVHTEAGATYPLAWADTIGRSRVVFNALGHATVAYDSPVRARLVQREAQWCLGLEPTA